MNGLLTRGMLGLMISDEEMEKRQLPGDCSFPALSGAEKGLLTGTWGEANVQEYQGGQFLIRYSVFNIKTELAFSIPVDNDFIHALIVLKGKFCSVDNDGEELKERQYKFLNGDDPFNLKIGNGTNIIFEVMMSKDATDLIENVSELSEVETELVHTHYMTEEVRELVRYVLNYGGQQAYRDNYYLLKARDILFQLLIQHNNGIELDEEIPTAQVSQAWAAERLIMEDLTNHLLIRQLSRRVQTSETILKRAFKRVFGMGLHEYLVYQRLMKANAMLQSGCSVKETAANLGWRSADLIKAYSKRYGTTPGTAKKKRTF